MGMAISSVKYRKDNIQHIAGAQTNKQTSSGLSQHLNASGHKVTHYRIIDRDYDTFSLSVRESAHILTNRPTLNLNDSYPINQSWYHLLSDA